MVISTSRTPKRYSVFPSQTPSLCPNLNVGIILTIIVQLFGLSRIFKGNLEISRKFKKLFALWMPKNERNPTMVKFEQFLVLSSLINYSFSLGVAGHKIRGYHLQLATSKNPSGTWFMADGIILHQLRRNNNFITFLEEVPVVTKETHNGHGLLLPLLPYCTHVDPQIFV